MTRASTSRHQLLLRTGPSHHFTHRRMVNALAPHATETRLTSVVALSTTRHYHHHGEVDLSTKESHGLRGRPTTALFAAKTQTPPILFRHFLYPSRLPRVIRLVQLLPAVRASQLAALARLPPRPVVLGSQVPLDRLASADLISSSGNPPS